MDKEKKREKRYFISQYVCKFGNINKLEVFNHSEKAYKLVLNVQPFKKAKEIVVKLFFPKKAVTIHNSKAMEINPWAFQMFIDSGLYVNAIDAPQK